jgi:hypothetical protein
MHATITGVSIGIVAGLTFLLTKARTQLLAEQADRVAEVIEDLLGGRTDPPALIAAARVKPKSPPRDSAGMVVRRAVIPPRRVPEEVVDEIECTTAGAD